MKGVRGPRWGRWCATGRDRHGRPVHLGYHPSPEAAGEVVKRFERAGQRLRGRASKYSTTMDWVVMKP